MVLDELAAYLVANGFGTQGTNIFEGRHPDTPDVLVSLHEYPGEGGDPTLSDVGVSIEHPRVQVICRDVDYGAARTTAESIYKLLRTTIHQTLSGVRYLKINAIAPPFALQRDKADRALIACNFEIWKDTST